MEFILMTDIMWIIFYILEPTTMTPKETREYTFLYTRALFFSDLFRAFRLRRKDLLLFCFFIIFFFWTNVGQTF